MSDWYEQALKNAKEIDAKTKAAESARIAEQNKKNAATKPSTKSEKKAEPSKNKLENKKKQSQKKATATAAAVSTSKKSSSSKKSSGYKKQTVSASTQKAAKAISDSQASKSSSVKSNKSGTAKGNTGSNRLSKKQQKIQAQALMADNLPTAIQRGVMGAAQGFVNSTVGVPSAILAGERMAKPSDALREAGVDKTAGFQVGNAAGEFAGYTTLGGLANTGVAGLLSKTKLGKLAAMGSATPAGVAADASLKQKAIETLGRNALETATVGTLQNAAMDLDGGRLLSGLTRGDLKA